MLDELITGPYLQCALCGEGGHRISLQEGKEKFIPGLHSHRSTNHIKAFFKKKNGMVQRGKELGTESLMMGVQSWDP